ncbi:hypothetical protein C7G42_05255 [Bradyrhizobium sp. MOS003]|nr:hypothetical protein C7G42_05255 [Bradyrhizobium sp. MOS003]
MVSTHGCTLALFMGDGRLADVIAAGALQFLSSEKERYSVPAMIARQVRKANFEPRVTLLVAASAKGHPITG